MKRFILFSALSLLLWCGPVGLSYAENNFSTPHDRLLAKAMEKGGVNVIVKLKVENLQRLTRESSRYRQVKPGRRFPAAGHSADAALALAIGHEADSLLTELEGMDFQLNHRYNALPYLALTVSAQTLALLETLPGVESIVEDRLRRLPPSAGHKNNKLSQPKLLTSTGIIGAPNAWVLGYGGKGWYVAILDTGILRTHEFFQDKTIIEACYSAEKDCPNNKSSMTGNGAAAPFDSIYDGYDHGTHVAGIAAGNAGMINYGVAKDSNIIMIQVFSRFSAEDCGGTPCIASWDSDQIKGLDYIYSLRSKYSIASVNLSLGGGSFTAYCNDQPQASAMDILKTAGIATVVATGNDYACGSVASPACIQSAVAVGASDNEDGEAVFNNWHATIQEFFAPGGYIKSSVASSNTAYEYKSGTSMAAPHVAGAWAILKQAVPDAPVDTIFYNLQNTGTPITSTWCGDDAVPRINVDTALAQMLTSSGNMPAIAFNRNELFFNALIGGTVSLPQQVTINTGEDDSSTWSVSSNKSWLKCTPLSGSGYGVLTVSAHPAGLTAGNYSGKITVTSDGAINSPESFDVHLNVITAAQDQLPFGTLSTPVNGSILSGSIAITGWALDDTGIDRVDIYNGNSYIGQAVFIEGARPDVQTRYYNYPQSYKAGWGYMLLTYFLPGGGNGDYTLNAKAMDLSGNTVTLGSATITINNANRKKPFGALDTPTQGGTASGESYINWGWVLTPQPNNIPIDGSTINVWIDGKNVGHPVYNIYRADLAALFPAYANTGGAAGYFYIDTGTYQNGLHTIQWTARDSAGNSDGIGSRYFMVQNTGSRSTSSGKSHVRYISPDPGLHLSFDPVHRTLPVGMRVKRGVRVDSSGYEITPDRRGIYNIEIREMERLEIQFHDTVQSVLSISPLPTGSTLDNKDSVFYWLPGPGYVGTYDFEFIARNSSGLWIPAPVRISILPQK